MTEEPIYWGNDCDPLDQYYDIEYDPKEDTKEYNIDYLLNDLPMKYDDKEIQCNSSNTGQTRESNIDRA